MMSLYSELSEPDLPPSTMYSRGGNLPQNSEISMNMDALQQRADQSRSISFSCLYEDSSEDEDDTNHQNSESSSEGFFKMANDSLVKEYHEKIEISGSQRRTQGGSGLDDVSCRVRFSPDSPVVHCIERTPPDEMHLIYYSAHELQRMMDEFRDEESARRKSLVALIN